MGEIISARTHLLDGKIRHQKVVVIKPNYFPQELGLTPCSKRKVTKGIDSNYLEVIKASDFFFSKTDSTIQLRENNESKPNMILSGNLDMNRRRCLSVCHLICLSACSVVVDMSHVLT